MFSPSRWEDTTAPERTLLLPSISAARRLDRLCGSVQEEGWMTGISTGQPQIRSHRMKSVQFLLIFFKDENPKIPIGASKRKPLLHF